MSTGVEGLDPPTPPSPRAPHLLQAQPWRGICPHAGNPTCSFVRMYAGFQMLSWSAFREGGFVQ